MNHEQTVSTTLRYMYIRTHEFFLVKNVHIHFYWDLHTENIFETVIKIIVKLTYRRFKKKNKQEHALPDQATTPPPFFVKKKTFKCM